MTPKIREHMDETILLLENKFQIGEITQNMIRTMCQTIYLDGMQRGLELIKMMLENKISPEEIKKYVDQLNNLKNK